MEKVQSLKSDLKHLVKHQREVAIAIKRARVAALIPFKAD